VIRHVVLMRFKKTADPDDLARFQREVKTLATDVETVRAFWSGPNVGNSSEGLAAEPEFDANYDFAVVADFDDYGGYQAYADSDAHHRLVESVVRRILESRIAVQFDIP
jgi:hypothetical protein